MKTRVLYECETCGRRSESQEEIVACEARGIERNSSIEVGDIVIARAGFGWFDGDKRWVANYRRIGPKRHPFDKKHADHGNCFGACCTYQFFYVVTAIEPSPDDKHRLRYHLATKAMSPASGYHAGWTVDDGGHFTPVRVVPQPKLDAAELVGRKAECLL